MIHYNSNTGLPAVDVNRLLVHSMGGGGRGELFQAGDGRLLRILNGESIFKERWARGEEG